MSTTADKRVAIQYSGVREGRPRATILVITCGAVDRGACIRDFSQYPSEIEYLWLPCSFVQPSGSRFVEVSSSGVVTMVPVRVNANLKTMTVEEILGQKKAMHLASFRYLQGELKRDLEHIVETEGGSARLLADTSPKKSKFSVRGFLRHIQKQGQEVYERHCAVEAAGYIGDDDYRALVTEMLDVKAFALSKLLWWLSDRSQLISYKQPEPLRLAHRGWIAFLERMLPSSADRQRDALALCRAKGLLRRSVAEENELGESRLVCAAAEGWSVEDLELLVEAGGSVHGGGVKGASPLYSAAQNGRSASVSALVRLKADVNAANDNGATPLFAAAQGGHVGCVESLLGLGADANQAKSNGWTPVCVAAWKGHVACIARLADGGADLNAAASDGRTPVAVAVHMFHLDCVEALARLGADLRIGQSDVGELLHVAAAKGHANAISTLARLGGEVDRRARSGWTPLFVVAAAAAGGEDSSSSAADCVRALLSLRADAGAVDSAGRTPLMVAASRGRVDAALALAASAGVQGLEVRVDGARNEVRLGVWLRIGLSALAFFCCGNWAAVLPPSFRRHSAVIPPSFRRHAVIGGECANASEDLPGQRRVCAYTDEGREPGRPFPACIFTVKGGSAHTARETFPGLPLQPGRPSPACLYRQGDPFRPAFSWPKAGLRKVPFMP
jgi:ankyrin repeat protein